jgi:hypothetical protein
MLTFLSSFERRDSEAELARYGRTACWSSGLFCLGRPVWAAYAGALRFLPSNLPVPAETAVAMVMVVALVVLMSGGVGAPFAEPALPRQPHR